MAIIRPTHIQSPFVELYWRRGLSWISAATTGMFAALGLLVAARSDASPAVPAFGALVVVTCALAALGFVMRARERRPILVVTTSGLRDPTGVFLIGDVDWSMVRRVRRSRVALPGFRRVRIELDAAFRTARPVSFGDRAILFLRTGSTSTRINLVTGAVKGPRGWVACLHDAATAQRP